MTWPIRYVRVFLATLGRRNDYYWPGHRAGIRTAHLVARLVAGHLPWEGGPNAGQPRTG